MCDRDNHQGLIEDWQFSRRMFVAGGVAAAGLASSAYARTANVAEKDVAIRTADGTADAALFTPAGKGAWPGVLLWPDLLGLRPVMRDMATRLAASGYVVLVPNPFYRDKPAPVIAPPFNFANPQDREILMGFRQKLTEKAVDGDARAFIAFLDAQKQTSKRRKAGVQGYCMGGALAFRTAAAVPGRIGAVASFHGGGLVGGEPSSPHLLIPSTRASYLVAVAKNDDAREPQAKTMLRNTFATARRPAIVDVYAGDHGWCVPGSQAYHQAEAERAWAELLRLYKKNL